ncbi:ABC transporter permease [Aggregatilinea sp.]|uniref:ABC transporter permease n=1 Tax=Aggregatilinea sp. TaxID=2806333 RepID=UPI002D1FBA53|nr:FtsX-like permease family protein [Aggregatilinea sp.]
MYNHAQNDITETLLAAAVIGIRLRKIGRDIAARKIRTVLVSASIFIGVLGVVILTTLGQLLTRQMQKDLRPDELAMFRIFLDAPTAASADMLAPLERLREWPGVTAVEGQAVYEFAWRGAGETEFHAGQLFAYTKPFGAIQLEPIRLLRGRYPIDGEHEVAVEQRMAEHYGLHIGDTLTVEMAGIAERPQESWRIVGLVYQPYVYLGSDGAESNVFATFDDAQQIVGFKGLSSIYLRFENFATARQQARDIRPYITNETDYSISFTLTDDPQQNLYVVGAQRFSGILTILGVVAMIVSSFLVTNVISTVITEQRRQIGAMKALGATTMDIFVIYIGTALAYGLIGTIPGMIVGAYIGQQAALAAAPLANVILEDATPPLAAVALGLGLGLGVPVIAALPPILNGLRVTILEAMTDQGLQARYGRGLTGRVVQWIPVGPVIRQALNSILQRWTRLALTTLSLALAVAAFMGVFAVFHTLNRVVTGMRETLNYDVATDVQALELLRIAQGIPATEDEIREIEPGVAIKVNVAPLEETPPDDGSEPSASEDNSIFVTGVAAVNLPDLKLESDLTWPELTADSIIITPQIASKLDKSVGDTLRLTTGATTRDFTIVALADFPLETAFMEWQALADFVGEVQEAPSPNAYWAQVGVSLSTDGQETHAIWAVGIDESIGGALTPEFNPEEPGLIISQALATAGNLAIGDELTLHTDANERAYPIQQIVNISSSQIQMFAQDVPDEVLSQGTNMQVIALYWETLESLQGIDFRSASPEMFYINLDQPDTFALTIPRYTPLAVHKNQLAVTDTIAQTIVSVGWVMGVAAGLMALVGGIGLLTISAIGVVERRREIGVMRSVGATSVMVARQFLIEGVIVGVVAWAVGVPLSIALSDMLIQAAPFREVIPADYPSYVPGVGLISMFALTLASTLYPALSATRMTISEILRYQ